MQPGEPPSDPDIVRKIFLEEHFIGHSGVEDSAIYISRENYLNLSNLLKIIDGFFALPFLEQVAYLKVLPQMLGTLTLSGVPGFLQKIYNPAVEVQFIRERFELYLLLVESAPMIIEFLQASRIVVSKRNTLAREESGAPRPKGSGIFSGSLDEPFKLQVLEIVVKMLDCGNHAKSQRLTEAIGRLSDALNQFENDNKLLFVVLSILHDGSSDKNVLTGLQLIERIVRNCSAAYVEGFVAIDILSLLDHKDPVARRAAHACFVSVLQAFRAEFLQKRFADAIERMTNHRELEVRVIFIQNVHLIAEKMKYDFVKDKILPAFSAMLTSPAKVIKEQSLLRLGKFLAVCLQKIHSMFNPRTEILDSQLKIFFNLFLFTEGLDRLVRTRIIAENFADLADVMRLFGRKLWPYLRFAIEKLDEYPDAGIVEAVKLALVRQIGPVAALLGQAIVEKELILTFDQRFLTLSTKTSQQVKLKSIENLAAVLKIISPASRKFFVDYYISLQDDTKKWRIRASICNQIPDLLELFEPFDIVSFIAPMFFVFCKDPCAMVRKLTAEKFYLLVQALRDKGEPNLFVILENMKSFATKPSFNLRQVFVGLFASLFANCGREVDEEMREALVGLTSDPIPNVRISVAIFVATVIDDFPDDPFLARVHSRLLLEANADIQTILQAAKARFRTEQLQEVVKSEIAGSRLQAPKLF